jgi:hypothetical protein
MTNLLSKEMYDAYSIRNASSLTKLSDENETMSEHEYRPLIINSKLFICLINRSYLNSMRCMSELALAHRLSKTIFILLDTTEVNISEIELTNNCKVFDCLNGSEKHPHVHLFLK